MKVIIAGSRDIFPTNGSAVIDSGFNITEIVSGGARGVDSWAIDYAIWHCFPYKVFKANWKELGKSAGIKRNLEMAAYADALIAIWDGVSKGTKHMIEAMQKLNKPVFIYNETHDQ